MSMLQAYRFSVDEYHRMTAAGILTEDHNVELLDGWIVQKMARNPPHETAIELIDENLRPRLPAGWRGLLAVAGRPLQSAQRLERGAHL